MSGAAACGEEQGKVRQTTQEQPKEETTVAATGPGQQPSYEQIPEDVKAKLPDDAKQKIKENDQGQEEMRQKMREEQQQQP